MKTPVQTPGSVKRGRGRPKKSESLKSTPSSSKTTPKIAKEKKLSLPLMKKTPKATPEHITVANLKAKEPRRSVGRSKKSSPSPDPALAEQLSTRLKMCSKKKRKVTTIYLHFSIKRVFMIVKLEVIWCNMSRVYKNKIIRQIV